jgi:hypothetical protein
MSDNNAIECKIIRKTGSEEACTIAEFIRAQAEQCPPLLAWAEPEHTAVDVNGATGRRRDFALLVTGEPAWPDGVPLVEARLFWEKAALHVIATDKGCRWARIEEGGSKGEEVTRSKTPVFTLRDRNRFGLNEEQEISELIAIEYRQHGRLVAWRLINRKGNANG